MNFVKMKFTPVSVFILVAMVLLSACGSAAKPASTTVSSPSPTAAAATSAANSPSPSASAQTGADTSGKPLTTVSVATLPVTDVASVVLAQKEGIFKKYGLDVKLNVVQTGPATTSAIVSGAAEFSQSNYATLITAKTNNVPILIVSEAARAKKGFSAVLSAKGSPIKTPKDLEGKRIATAAIGGIGPISISAWMKANNLDYTAIKWVQMPFQDMGAALERNQIDAAWVVEPFQTNITKTSGAQVVFDVFSGPTEGMPVAAYATSEKYAKEHPEIVEAFRKGIEEVGVFVQKNPDAIKQVIPTYTTLSADLVNQIGMEDYPATTSVEQIQRVAKAMRDTGNLNQDFNVDTIIWKSAK